MTKYTCLLLIAAMIGFIACENALESVDETDEDGYRETYQRHKETYAKEGLYSRYNPDGSLLETANYQNDTLDGARVIYYENGDTNIVENYQNGRFHGTYQVYYEEGGVLQEGRFEDNVMTGDWMKYYSSGQVMERVAFKDNLENGPFVEYYGNGHLKAEGTFQDGDNEQGELKLYDESGQLTRIMQCKLGRCETTWSLEEGTDPPTE